MNISALNQWLAQPRTALTQAITADIRDHVSSLKSRGIEFYGYALLPGEPYDIQSITAVTNSPSNIKIPSDHKQYAYYRYGIDEWGNWEPGKFVRADAVIAQLNQEFARLHSKQDDDYTMDEFERAHSNSLLKAMLEGLKAAKIGKVFSPTDPFLVLWISDSGHEIMRESIKQLNPKNVVDEFSAEFG